MRVPETAMLRMLIILPTHPTAGIGGGNQNLI
jgi:hypothetical protein